MIRHCDGNDQFLKNCGRTFDDAECTTICPHDPLPLKLTEDELAELFDAVSNDRPLDTSRFRAEILDQWARTKSEGVPA